MRMHRSPFRYKQTIPSAQCTGAQYCQEKIIDAGVPCNGFIYANSSAVSTRSYGGIYILAQARGNLEFVNIH